MKIRYRHYHTPDVVKIYDTEKSLKANEGFFRMLGEVPTQEKFDEHELELLKRDQERGVILWWEVVKEDETSVS